LLIINATNVSYTEHDKMVDRLTRQTTYR